LGSLVGDVKEKKMFWIMMYMLLFGGSVLPELTLVPEGNAIVETVSYEERVQAIMSIRDEMASQEEALVSFMKEQYAELIALSRDYTATNDDFRTVFEHMDRERNTIQSALIENRFRMKRQMTREEWKAVFKKK